MPKRYSIGTKLLGIASRLVRKNSRHTTLVDEKTSQKSDNQRADTHPLLNRLSQSNSPPQEHEVELIQECITRDTADRNRLAESLQAKGNDKHKTRLEHQIDSLDLAIQSWKSLLSPVRRLPADILLEIFGYLLVPVNKTSDLPWRLSHICRYWRDIILNSPIMWRHFPVISPVTSELAESQQIKLVQTLIGRVPHFLELCMLESTTNQLSRPILSLLAELSQKWKKLTISATLQTLQYIFVGENYLESLEELTLDFLYIDDEGGPTHNINVVLFQSAPTLRRVTLTGEFHGRIVLPTSLTLLHDMSWGINSQERLLTIGRYDRLQDLRITDAEIFLLGSEDAEEPGRVHLPQLNDLSLKCGVNAETGLLRIGVFPNLRSIDIDARDGGSGDVCRVLAALLSRSNCHTVETLRLDLPENARNSQLSLVLHMTPHLKELRCYLPSDPDIQQMALPDSGQDILVPNLTKCTFVLQEPSRWHWQVTVDAVQSFIASRCGDSVTPDHPLHLGSSGMVFKFCEYDNSTGYPSQDLVLAQTRFETWYTDARRTPLFLFQQLLGHRLPNLRETHPHRVPLSQSMISGATKILTRIEGYEPRDINEVIMSGAHVILARLLHLSSDDLVKENMFKPFRDQVLRVQDKWQILLADTSNVHWIWTCPALNEIQYIPDWSAYRKDVAWFNKSFMAIPPQAN